VIRSSASQLTRTVFTYLTLLLVTLCGIYLLGPLEVPMRSAAVQFKTSWLRCLGESSLVALTVAITGLGLASAVGYAFSRSRFLRRSSTFSGALLAQLLPAIILLAALCLGLVWLGLIASYLGLFIIYLVTTLPFCIWQMKRNYDAIPISFEEAAEIDGASVWQSFSRILLPLGMPALATTGLFSLFVAWNESVIGTILLGNPGISALRVLPNRFLSPAPCFAAVSLVPIVGVLIFLLLSRFFVASLRAGRRTIEVTSAPTSER
jgi:arabinogalactan oligomer/maltooligosaccharide transport system permease protein